MIRLVVQGARVVCRELSRAGQINSLIFILQVEGARRRPGIDRLQPAIGAYIERDQGEGGSRFHRGYGIKRPVVNVDLRDEPDARYVVDALRVCRIPHVHDRHSLNTGIGVRNRDIDEAASIRNIVVAAGRKRHIADHQGIRG